MSMEPDDLGHRETQTRLPDPLQSTGLWTTVTTWALPATLLSWASAGVFLITFLFLQRDAQMRALFRLDLQAICPDGDRCLLIIAGLTALLAWTLVWRCRRRPGRHWPRYWTLALALVTTTVAAGFTLGLPPAWTAQGHALLVAGAAATLALAPRLLNIHPDSAWMQRIAPVSLLLVLAVILPPAWQVGRATLEDRAGWLQTRLQELQTRTAVLQTCTEAPAGCTADEYRRGRQELLAVLDAPVLRDSAAALGRQQHLEQATAALFDAAVIQRLHGQIQRIRQNLDTDWRRPAADLTGTRRRLDDLNRLSFADLPELTAAAAALGETATLEPLYGQLLDGVTAGLDPARVPRLTEPPVAYADGDGPWPLNPRFATVSRAVTGYYRQLQRLFAELGTVAEAPLQAAYHRRRADWDSRVQALQQSWATGWLTPLLAGTATRASTDPAALAAVLQTPVIGELAPANLTALLDLELGAVRGNSAANCRPSDYQRQKANYFRLDCRAYTLTPAATGDPGAALRVEFRLIYQSKKPLAESLKPDRLYFIVPMPAGTDPEAAQLAFEGALLEARQAVGDGGQVSIEYAVKPFADGQDYLQAIVTRRGVA